MRLHQYSLFVGVVRLLRFLSILFVDDHSNQSTKDIDVIPQIIVELMVETVYIGLIGCGTVGGGSDEF